MLRANGSLGVSSLVVIAAALTAAPAIFHARAILMGGSSPFASAFSVREPGNAEGHPPDELRVDPYIVEGFEGPPANSAGGSVTTFPEKPLPDAGWNRPALPSGNAQSFGMNGNLEVVEGRHQTGPTPPFSRIGMIAAYASAMRDKDLEGAARALAQASNRSLSSDAVQALNAKLGIEADHADVAAVVARAAAIQSSGVP